MAIFDWSAYNNALSMSQELAEAYLNSVSGVPASLAPPKPVTAVRPSAPPPAPKPPAPVVPVRPQANKIGSAPVPTVTAPTYNAAVNLQAARDQGYYRPGSHRVTWEEALQAVENGYGNPADFGLGAAAWTPAPRQTYGELFSEQFGTAAPAGLAPLMPEEAAGRYTSGGLFDRGLFQAPGTDIPIYSDVARAAQDALAPALGAVTGAAKAATPYLQGTPLGGVARALGGLEPASDEIASVGKYIIPVTLEEVGLELVPGIGSAGDIVRATSRSGRAAMTRLTEAGFVDASGRLLRKTDEALQFLGSAVTPRMGIETPGDRLLGDVTRAAKGGTPEGAPIADVIAWQRRQLEAATSPVERFFLNQELKDLLTAQRGGMARVPDTYFGRKGVPPELVLRPADDALAKGSAEAVTAADELADLRRVADALPTTSPDASLTPAAVADTPASSPEPGESILGRTFYHGTPDAATGLRSGEQGVIYLSPSSSEAAAFSGPKGGQGTVIPVTLKTDNVFDPSNPAHLARVGAEEEDRLWDSAYNRAWIEKIRQAGFDGFWERDVGGLGSYGPWNLGILDESAIAPGVAAGGPPPVDPPVDPRDVLQRAQANPRNVTNQELDDALEAVGLPRRPPGSYGKTTPIRQLQRALDTAPTSSTPQPPVARPVDAGGVPPREPPKPPRNRRPTSTAPEPEPAPEPMIADGDAISPGVPVSAGGDPVARLVDVVQTTRRLPPQTEALRSAERRQRVAIGASSLQRGDYSPEAFRRARGALSGEMPRVQFEAPELNFTPDEVQAFRSQIGSANLRFFEQLNAETALSKVLSGNLNEVTPSEITLLEKVFGPELASAVASRQGVKWGDELISALGLPRTLKASFDISAPGRQGLALGVRHPKEWLESWAPMLKAWASEGQARAYGQWSEGVMRTWRDQFDEDLIHLYNDVERVPGFEPQGRSRIAEWLRKIPGISNSERAFATFLNVQKAKTFNTMATSLQRAGVTDAEHYRHLGNIIDHATGFGGAPLGRSTAGQLGGQTFFSQRLMASRFQFLTDPIVEGLLKGDLRAARAATENLVAFFGAQMGLLALGHEMGVWDATFDPRSTDFGKIRIGPLRIDTMAGFSPLIRQAARVATGERKSLTGDTFNTSRSTEALRFFQNKLAPVPSTLVNLVSGENMIGEKPTVESVMKDLFMPMFVDSFIEGLNTGGIEGGLAAVLPEAVGFGTLNYGAGQAAQVDIARHEYRSEYDDLRARDQAEINAQAAASGVEMAWSDRQAPWWTAREDGMERWLFDMEQKNPELANDPFVKQAQSVSKYADLATELSAWAQESYGLSRIEAEKAVDRFLRETRLQDYVNAYRKEVLDADPEFLKAWDEAFENGDVEYAPPKWVREFIEEREAA